MGVGVRISPKVWGVGIWELWELYDYVGIVKKLDNGVVVHRSVGNLIVELPKTVEEMVVKGS